MISPLVFDRLASWFLAAPYRCRLAARPDKAAAAFLQTPAAMSLPTAALVNGHPGKTEPYLANSLRENHTVAILFMPL